MSAYDQALTILGRRAYTTHEVRLRLRRKGYPRSEIDAALDRLTTAKLLDDATLLDHLAQRRARTLRGLDPLVRRRRLYAFLARRGYGSEAIARVLEANR
jgi:regulatory protein